METEIPSLGTSLSTFAQTRQWEGNKNNKISVKELHFFSLDRRVYCLVQSIIIQNTPRQSFKMCTCVELPVTETVSEHVPNCIVIKFGSRSLVLQSTTTLSDTHQSQWTSTHFLTYLAAISLSGVFYLRSTLPATQQFHHGRCHNLPLTMETKNPQIVMSTIRVLLHHGARIIPKGEKNKYLKEYSVLSFLSFPMP